MARGDSNVDAGEGEQPERTSAEVDTEDEIEAEAQAEMHDLRNMLNQVGRKDFLEGLFTLLKALNSLIGYMKAMNRHVSKIDEKIANNTNLLRSLDEKLTTLVERKPVDAKQTKASPNLYQGSSSQHASAAVFDAETPTAPMPPIRFTSKSLARDPETFDEVKKNLDMCVDLTISDDEVPDLNKVPTKGPDVESGATKGQSLKQMHNKSTKKRAVSRGKEVFKSMEVEFDVSDSDSDDCTIIESPTQSKLKTSEVNVSGTKAFPKQDKTKDKGKKVATDCTPTRRPRKMARALKTPVMKNYSKRVGHTLPKEMESKFRPTPEMGLTADDLRICAYVFQIHGDPREELFKMGSSIGTRENFYSLCPDQVIDSKIIDFMAFKLTWNQHNTEAQPAWILPPRFADGVLKGKMSEDLLPEFAEQWMAPFDTLKYIYVPVREANGEWFLMVASMDEMVIYLVDSCLSAQQTSARKKSIRAIGKVIGRMVFSSYYPQNYLEGNFELGTWDIEEAKSSEDYTASTQHSTLCTLEWMQMDDVFMSNLLPRVEDKLVRMKAVMSLLTGPHNEHFKMLLGKANNFWESQMLNKD